MLGNTWFDEYIQGISDEALLSELKRVERLELVCKAALFHAQRVKGTKRTPGIAKKGPRKRKQEDTDICNCLHSRDNHHTYGKYCLRCDCRDFKSPSQALADKIAANQMRDE